ncbi:methylmalonyl Co-A mutase-associated GTPase MeaB [Pseudotamlana carrageenivorans]|uniref:Methylmalonyl Co-A mutase-associated GTPase MeaB n=1 Tax=Pseudotamlana carrageenivorans TaxID=2069432 RepID=A0A2I7SMH9_9FLAO|nr:methylmalonyl Co-A mutase-associated GTPase MeaB [Tamlana carrageenivorans]AUS07108.1 methylmalonyl Co-A mutase-associated GTPase MeaB [Tamlana carrageenivorans]
MSKPKKTSIQENEGVSISEITNPEAIERFKSRRNKTIDVDDLISSLLNKNISALSRAITIVESEHPKHTAQASAITKACLPKANKSIRIGITGVPGVGKSTFIEAFGHHLSRQGKRIAVLAIDPSSSITKGSILGDKTRMEDLVKNKNVFIRPSASGNSLGGVARKTRESIVLCEAAGFDVVIIETVGVGQSETTVHSMVDFFLLLKLPGAGDELQGIKRGIIEMADAIAINKADGDNLKKAKVAQTDFKNALHLYPNNKSEWQPQVSLCSALNKVGIDAIWQQVLDYVQITSANHYFNEKRHEQNKYWLIQTIESQLKADFFNKPEIKAALKEQLQLLDLNKTTPFAAAEYLLKLKH